MNNGGINKNAGFLKRYKNLPETEITVDKMNEDSMELSRNNPKQSYIISSEANLLSIKLNYSRGIAESLRNMGNCLWGFAEYAPALEKCIEAIKIFRQLNYKKGEADTINTIAGVYTSLGDYENALKYNFDCLKIRKEIDDKKGIVGSLNNIGDKYLKMGNNQKALLKFKACLVIPGISDQAKAVVLCNIGEVFFNLDKFSSSLKYLNQSLEISLKIDFKDISVACYLLTGKILILQNELSNALKYLRKALQIAVEQGSKESISGIHQVLSMAFEKQGNIQKAYENYKLFHQFQEALFNSENAQKIKNLQFSFQSQAIQREADLERLKNTELKKAYDEIENQRNIIFERNETQSKANAQLALQKADLEKSDKEKEVLIKEIHHRVKNNLQIISSLLNLQSKKVKDKNVSEALQEGRNRVKAMSLIHQKLYLKEDLSIVDLNEYIGDICKSLFQSYADSDRIRLQLDILQIKLNIDSSILLGLLVNEIVTNALKYAFPEERKGVVFIKLWQSDSNLELMISDNGIGMPKDFNIKNPEKFGLQLVSSLIHKLKGSFEIQVQDGTKIHFVFPVPN